MYIIFLGLLVVAWVVYLGSTFLGRRGTGSGGNSSIRGFNRQLEVIGGASPATTLSGGTVSARPTPLPVPPWAMPISLSDAHRRRIEVIFTLLGGAAMALLLGVLITRWALLLHVALDVMLVGYLFLLARSQNLADERAQKVRSIDASNAARTRKALAADTPAGEADVEEAPIAVGGTPGFRVLSNHPVQRR